jgi:hypothetical protein
MGRGPGLGTRVRVTLMPICLYMRSKEYPGNTPLFPLQVVKMVS